MKTHLTKTCLHLVALLFTVAISAIAVPVILFTLLNLPVGQKIIANMLEEKFNLTHEVQMSIGSVHGVLPHLHIDHLHWTDRRGVFVELNNVDALLAPADLMHGKVHLSYLHIGEIHQLHILDRKTPITNYYAIIRAVFAPNYIVDRVTIDQLVFDAPVFGKKQRYEIHGTIGENKRIAIMHGLDGLQIATTITAYPYDSGWLHEIHFTMDDHDLFSARMLAVAPSDDITITLGGIVYGNMNHPAATFAGTMHSSAAEDTTFSPLAIHYGDYNAVFSGTVSPQKMNSDLMTLLPLPATLPPQLLAITGKALPITAHIETNWHAHLAEVSMIANGTDSLFRTNVTANWQEKMLKNGHYELTSPLAKLSGIYSGPFKTPKFDLDAHTNSMTFHEQTVPPLNAHIEASIGERTIVIPVLQLKNDDGAIIGNLTIDRISKLASGQLSGIVPQIMGFTAARNSSFALALQTSGGKQQATLHTILKAASYHNLQADNADITADISDLFGAKQLTLKAEIDRLSNGNFLSDKTTITALGDARHLHFLMSSHGELMREYIVNAQGDLAMDGTRQFFELTTFQGTYGSVPYSLTKPLAFQIQNDTISVKPTQLNYGNGNLVMNADISSRNADISATLTHIDIASLLGNSETKGNINGTFHLYGNPANPEGSLSLSLKKLGYTSDKTAISAINLIMTGNFKDSQLSTSLSASLGDAEQAHADLHLPLMLSLKPFHLAMAGTNPLSGHIHAQPQLDKWPSMLLLDNQRMSGKLVADILLGGTIAAPIWSGGITLEQGNYEHIANGILLKNISTKLLLTGNQLTVQHFTASDVAQGKLTIDGSIHLNDTTPLSTALRLTFEHFALVHKDDLQIQGSGGLTITGLIKEPTIAGKMLIESSQFTIPDHSQAQIGNLHVVEINLPTDLHHKNKNQEPAPIQSVIHLAISARFPDNAILRGRGLESKWHGDLQINGTVAQPIVVGSLQMVNGSLNLFSRDFTLIDSEVQFRGPVPPSPYLNITAETRVETEDLTADLKITGSAKNPNIDLVSSPTLPKEEIMSRLLFGEPLKTLTGAQALKLANMSRELLGNNNGDFGIVDRTKQILGVDTFDFKQNDTGNTSFGIGKHLYGKVYVGAEKDIGTGGGAVDMEVNVSRHIDVESRIGVDSKSDIGVNWKNDY